MGRDRRGQLDALLDVELVLPRAGDDALSAMTAVDDGTASSATQPPAIPLAPGTRLGKYVLERLLGAGGMGVVWRARDLDLDRAVALKVLAPALDGNDVARSRLVREARAMARLRHPNVITVFDATTLDGRDVIAMELIDGETLASWLVRPRSHDEIVAAIVAAGRGLAVAHAAGMIHRDFKPHNVLIEPRGRVVVTDFGLARAVGDSTVTIDPAAEPASSSATRPSRRYAAFATGSSDRHALGQLDSPLTAPGAVLGTPAYMAPEQLDGAPGDIRTDQFAFCATAWEAVTGQRPFLAATTAQLATAILCEPPRAADRVPRRIRAILERGLASDPAARWPSIDALLDAIVRAWRRPRRIRLALGIAGVVAMLAAGGMFAAVRLGSHRGPWQPRILDLPAFEENGDGAAISPDGTHLAFVSDRERTDTFRAYVATLPTGEAHPITPPGDSVQTPRWTRDGTALLLVRWDHASFRYRIIRQPLAGGPATDLGTGIAVDDCGDALVIADNDRKLAQLLLQYPDGTRHELIRNTSDSIHLPRCDRDGARIVFTRGPTIQQDTVNDIFVIDRAGRETALTRDHEAFGGTFTPDGSVVLSAMRNGKVELLEVPATGGPERQLTFDDAPHFSPDVSSDGTTLAFNLDTNAIVVVAGGAGEPRKLTTRRQKLDAAVLTHDGRHVIALRTDDHGEDIVAIATRDGSQRTLARGRAPFPSLDDRRVLFGTLAAPWRLLAIPIDGGEPTTIAELPGKLVGGADGPDGTEIQIKRDRALEAWWVTRDGRVEPRGIRGRVFPAPSGGWRAVQTFDTRFHLRFVAPGDPIAAGGHEVAPDSEQPSWLDDHRVAYAMGGAFHIIDVTTGAEVAQVPGPASGTRAMLAPDGTHWYNLEMIGHVTRHLIVNFADRRR